MPVEIRGEQRSISQIFTHEFSFAIPPYQRPYAWEREHAAALLDDLLTALGEGAGEVGSLDPYFLGSIVLVHHRDSHWDVVDGQQRLITLTILLAALRSLVPQQFAQQITTLLYDPVDPLRGLSARFRVRPRPQDGSFFERHIQHEDGIQRIQTLNSADLSDSQRNMRENALLYIEQLSQMPMEQRIRLAQYIVIRCLLIVVWTQDLDSAYRIFSVLNDRGLDLSYADILKAQVIGGVPQEFQHAYTAKWETAEDDVGRKDFENLLGYIRMLYRKQRQRDTILAEFRNYVIAQTPDSRRLIDEVILPNSEAYATIRDENYQHTSGAERVNAHLMWLNRIPDSDWLPPALLYLTRFRHDAVRCGRFFTDLERLAAGLMLCRTSIAKRIERYGTLLSAIESGALLSAAGSPLQLTPDECRDALRTLDSDLYRQNSRTRQYVLLRLDNMLSTGEAVYSFPTITVEHVLPQQPSAGSKWLDWFPTPQLRDQWVHRLGNLVLLSRRKNSRASNYDFERKKTTYFTKDGVSPFAITTQVIQERDWTPQVVERRQRDLLAQLKQLWRL